MKFRIFTEPTGDTIQWSIDRYDPSTRTFSERCWSFDTFAEALDALCEFVDVETASPSATMVP